MRNRFGMRDEEMGEGRGREDERFQGHRRDEREMSERGASGDSSYGHRGNHERTLSSQDDRYRSMGGGDFRGGERGFEGDWGRREEQGWGGQGGYGQREPQWQREHGGGDRGHFGGDRGYQGDRGHFGGDRGYQGDRGHFGGDRGYQGDRGYFGGDRGYQGDRGYFGGDRGYQGGYSRGERDDWRSRGFNEPGHRSSWGDENRGWQGSQHEWQQEGRGFGGFDPRSQGQGRYEGLLGGYGSSGASRGRPPKGYKRSDERIREDVCDRICQHPDLDASEVEVKVQNGEVILTGTVQDRRYKHMLEHIAEGAAGVIDVRNEIRMQRESQSMGGSTHERPGMSSSGAESKQPEARRNATS